MARTRQHRCGLGFTLYEMVLVLAIVATLSAIAAPRYFGSVARYRVEAAARRMASDLVHARETAKTTGLPQSVAVDRTDGTYTLIGRTHPDRSDQPYTVALSKEYGATISYMSLGTTGTITFNGYGIPDRGSDFVLEVGSAQKTVSLNGVSGRVLP